MTRKTKALTEQLRKLFEQNKGAGGLIEMPHWSFNVTSPLPGDTRFFGTIDFQIEKLKLNPDEKKLLVTAFFTTGIVGRSKRGWLFFSSGAKGQPELARATPTQVKTLPHLPDDWEELAVVVD